MGTDGTFSKNFVSPNVPSVPTFPIFPLISKRLPFCPSTRRQCASRHQIKDDRQKRIWELINVGKYRAVPSIGPIKVAHRIAVDKLPNQKYHQSRVQVPTDDFLLNGNHFPRLMRMAPVGEEKRGRCVFEGYNLVSVKLEPFGDNVVGARNITHQQLGIGTEKGSRIVAEVSDPQRNLCANRSTRAYHDWIRLDAMRINADPWSSAAFHLLQLFVHHAPLLSRDQILKDSNNRDNPRKENNPPIFRRFPIAVLLGIIADCLWQISLSCSTDSRRIAFEVISLGIYAVGMGLLVLTGFRWSWGWRLWWLWNLEQYGNDNRNGRY